MSRGPTRRQFLATAPFTLGLSPLPGNGEETDATIEPSTTAPTNGFTPAEHGFGFRNWSTIDALEGEYALDVIPEETVDRTVRERWREPLREHFAISLDSIPDVLLTTISRQLYVAVNQLSGTNGHCYGMVFAAQQYFERPDTIPIERRRASEITHPAEPLSDPTSTPVIDDIRRFHERQFLSFYSWFGRRAMRRPERIAYDRQLHALRATVDEFETAGITLFDDERQRAHQVLVYEVDERPSGTSLSVYDPNRSARTYEHESRTVDLEATGGGLTMKPYDSGYDHFVFNRYDRIVRAGVESAADPFAFVDESPTALRDRLFTVALFLVGSPDVELVVVGPNGGAVERIRSEFMDTSRTEYDAVRYRYGAEPGPYRIVVVGTNDGEYTLEVLAASLDGALLDKRVHASIESGSIHQYVATVPGSADETGGIERVRSGDDVPT